MKISVRLILLALIASLLNSCGGAQKPSEAPPKPSKNEFVDPHKHPAPKPIDFGWIEGDVKGKAVKCKSGKTLHVKTASVNTLTGQLIQSRTLVCRAELAKVQGGIAGEAAKKFADDN